MGTPVYTPVEECNFAGLRAPARRPFFLFRVRESAVARRERAGDYRSIGYR